MFIQFEDYAAHFERCAIKNNELLGCENTFRNKYPQQKLRNFKVKRENEWDSELEVSFRLEFELNNNGKGIYYLPIWSESTSNWILKNQKRVFPLELNGKLLEDYCLNFSMDPKFSVEELPKTEGIKIHDNICNFFLQTRGTKYFYFYQIRQK
jgi:hypothetical protein